MKAVITFDDTIDAETIIEAFECADGVLNIEILGCNNCYQEDAKKCFDECKNESNHVRKK